MGVHWSRSLAALPPQQARINSEFRQDPSAAGAPRAFTEADVPVLEMCRRGDGSRLALGGDGSGQVNSLARDVTVL